jgi:pyridoxal phosphate enzyme (YggS family)
MNLAERLQQIRQRIQIAASRAGRSADDVRLIAVSKRYPAEALRAAYELGVRDFGENYVQELVQKRAELADLSDLRFHLIGHLQRNKARHVIQAAHAIHSFDDTKTVAECGRRAVEAKRPLEVFIQVNMAGETQKEGCSPSQVQELVDSVLSLPSLRLQGLMTIPPAVTEPEQARPYFRQLYELQAALPVRLSRLSMGMSADFDIAIEEGATDVRVGTALFGARA